MTRINVVDPRDLTDEHLFAEWRELPRVFTLAAGSPAARAVNVARLCERVRGAKRPLHYRGTPVPDTFYDRLDTE